MAEAQWFVSSAWHLCTTRGSVELREDFLLTSIRIPRGTFKVARFLWIWFCFLFFVFILLAAAFSFLVFFQETFSTMRRDTVDTGCRYHERNRKVSRFGGLVMVYLWCSLGAITNKLVDFIPIYQSWTKLCMAGRQIYFRITETPNRNFTIIGGNVLWDLNGSI